MTSMSASLTPSLNVAGYCVLYEVEVGLRELIVSMLSDARGNGWAKRSLPPDILDKYKAGREAERATPWTQSALNHPIYYIDFPDVAKILETNSNWREHFDAVFRRRDIVVSALRASEPIRNKVAHNRTITSSDLAQLQSLHSLLTSSIGSDRFAELVRHRTSVLNAKARVCELLDEAQTAKIECASLSIPSPLTTWNSLRTEWWFDSDILEADLTPIEAFFAAMEAYASLPQRRGSGYLIGRWVASQNLDRLHDCAKSAVGEILKKA